MKIVLAGSGQSVSHWTPDEGKNIAPSPHGMALAAAREALGARREVDVLVVVRTTEDSVPTSTYPHGRNLNPPGTLARDLGVRAGELIYSGVGGQTPQALIGEMANRIADGEIESALVVGAEAVGAAKAARRAGLVLDWNDDDPATFEDRGAALDWVNAEELRHGLITPAQYYGLAESKLAHLHADTLAEYRRGMARLLAPFSKVASANPHSAFGQARSADWLATPSAENYPVAYPYLKWHVAQDAVNQGAAVLLMSEAAATKSAGTPLVYIRGGAQAADAVFSKRTDIAFNSAANAVFAHLPEFNHIDTTEIDLWDIYSCFPVAVWTALAALGFATPGLPAIGAELADIGGYETATPPKSLTVTGGLPFFGGPGNNYSLHAVAEMHRQLSGTDRTGLVLANGGWMSKVAAGLYSGAPVEFERVPPTAVVTDVCERVSDGGRGHLEAFTYLPGRGADASALSGTAFVRIGNTKRAIAIVSGEALERLIADPSPIGAEVRVDVRNGIGHLTFL